jgi:hypothetical protein
MTFQQLPLFNTHATGGNTAPEIAPTRRTAPQTSHDAGKRIGPHLSRLREQALAVIKASGTRGMTLDEVCAALGWDSTNSGRLTELKDQGLIVASGRRPNSKGNNATVYVAKENA